MFPMLCLRWAQLVVELLRKGTKLQYVRPNLDFHVHQVASIWNPSGSSWGQLQPNMTNRRQLGLQVGQRHATEV